MTALASPVADDTGEGRSLSMNPVGPIADRFAKDRTYLSCIMGPYGSAKTTTCFQRILWAAMWQRPGPDGVRRSRGCIIRDTYAQLQANVMKDWFAWFPKTKDNWNGETLTHTLRLEMPNLDGPGISSILEIEILFRALGEDGKAESVFKGMQLTWLWLNECDTLVQAVLKFGAPRVGRYPMAKDGGCAWSGIFADMNAPDIDNWTYELFVNEDLGLTPEEMDAMRAAYGSDFGVAFHRQPGGLEPEAENLMNLPPGYYDRLKISLTSENDQRRFIHNQFGAVRNGQPVYPEFIDSFHSSARDLQPVPELPIFIAVDGGSTPAAVFGQKMPDGQIRILDELVIYNPSEETALEKMGPKTFAKDCRDFIAERFPNARIKAGWGDPAAGYGGDEENLNWRDDFSREFKIRIKDAPVPGNRLTYRIEGVRDLLKTNISGKPGIIISKSCKHLRRGFNNGYVIERVKRSNGSGNWRDQPSKNDFSHVHDALQYIVAGFNRVTAVNDDLDRRHKARRVNSKVQYRGSAAGGRR